MSRFDYVKYDDQAQESQNTLKTAMMNIEGLVTKLTTTGRAQSLILTKLEEAYMWMGKAIRDDQIARNVTAELQEERGNQ